MSMMGGMIGRLLAASVVMTSMAAPAIAGGSLKDEPVYSSPAARWTGFYIGGTVGYGWGDSTHCDGGGCGPAVDPDGFVGGLTAGYNLQTGNIVLGIEGDYSWGDLSASEPSTPGYGCGSGCATDIDGFGTIRARIGYAMGSFMPYITGGVAFTDVSASLDGTGSDDFETSGVLGGGVEWIFAANWSAKLEYLHVFETDGFVFDPTRCVAPGCAVEDLSLDVVRLGVNYRF